MCAAELRCSICVYESMFRCVCFTLSRTHVITHKTCLYISVYVCVYIHMYVSYVCVYVSSVCMYVCCRVAVKFVCMYASMLRCRVYVFASMHSPAKGVTIRVLMCTPSRWFDSRQ
jgi:hypothetical protein